MPAVYASIPVICYDILLVVLAITVLGKHLKERKELKMKPNTYVVMIVRYHVIYFVLHADGGAESRTIVQEYRATDYRATSYYQHLGYACQRQLRTFNAPSLSTLLSTMYPSPYRLMASAVLSGSSGSSGGRARE
ncbi:uncharacterized protein BJ212DRAFT_1591543 [Suillus subaureus]|uniref:Uncharacterized protein n=1 Tax=Suillus subaureus TaxID=48587 RepID=A0A9P7J358_9AGAM|nr:uncharacterized protein BJ212DRAFT_1591543 [Suillus subaureus]KAG1800183.1 hypothetical protein BJ212DRAFT_1591543 [Suillus subaureus]